MAKKTKSSKAKRPESQPKKVPSGFNLLRQSCKQLYVNRKLFLGILVVYALLSLILVYGFSGVFRLGAFKETLSENFGGELDKVTSGFTLFGLLVSSVGQSSSEAGSVYQSILFVIVSLALIWAIRRTYKKSEKLSVKASFYHGMAPLIPFVLVGLVVLLEMIPFLVGLSLYTIVQANAFSIAAVERLIWLLVLLATMALSAYLVSTSLFAVYIVTLSKSSPVAALKAARKLVLYRRMMVIRKMLFLPFFILVSSAAVLVPLIILIPPLAEVIFLLFALVMIAVAHTYYYRLYRELI